jgi:hypothetical protein
VVKALGGEGEAGVTTIGDAEHIHTIVHLRLLVHVLPLAALPCLAKLCDLNLHGVCK